MSESINVENKKQNRQKPPLSIGRIAGEILAGLALGFVLLLVVYVTGSVLVGKVGPAESSGELEAILFLIMFTIVFSPLYGFGSAVGVYLLGTRGKQTGSFLLTLAGGFVGAIVVLLPSFSLFFSGKVIVHLVPLLLLLLIPPGMATLGFNLTRRYKEPPSS
jgi:hypothetical protein